MSHQNTSSPTKPPVPVLTSIYLVAAAIDVVFVVVAIILTVHGTFSLWECAGLSLILVISALIHYGLGQVVSYLAETAHYSRLTCEATMEIARRPLSVVESKAVNFPPLPGEETYHVKLDNSIHGPVTREGLEKFVQRGMVDRDAYVLPQGAHAWIRISELEGMLPKSRV